MTISTSQTQNIESYIAHCATLLTPVKPKIRTHTTPSLTHHTTCSVTPNHIWSHFIPIQNRISRGNNPQIVDPLSVTDAKRSDSLGKYFTFVTHK